MDTEEQLREALFELNQLRNSELAQLSQSQAVLAGLEKIAAAATPDAALDALLTSVRDSTDSDAALLLECVDARCEAIASTDADLGDCASVDVDFITKRPLRIVDLAAVTQHLGALGGDGRYLSMISAPFTVQTGEVLVLVCLSHQKAKLTKRDQQIAERLMSLASQTLATKKLTDQNALLAKVLDRSSASFSIADADDPECRLIYVNEAFETLTGYTKADVLGQNCRFLSAEDPKSEVRGKIRATIKDRVAGEFEVLNKRKDGVLFWNNLSIFPVDAGNKSYLVATQWDLTSRVEAEQDRDLARKQLVSALGSVKEGIVLLDPSDRIVFANDQYRRFYNLGTDALAHGDDFCRAWTQAGLRRGLTKSEASARAMSKLAALKKPCSQKERTLKSGFQVLETNAVTSVGGIVSVLSDVTAIKVVQQQLSERVAAIDSVQDGIAITDVEGRFIYQNPSHMQMFGYTKATELIGRKWSVLYEPEQMKFVRDVAIPTMMDTGQWRGDVMGRRKDGSAIAQEVTLTQLAGSGLICVTRDITDRIHNEKERITLREQLHTAQRQEAIGQMAAGLAHDFNNCLSVISGSAALALDAVTNDERVQHTQRIIEASKNAAELTGRLLRFGGRNSQRSRLDIQRPITSALGMVRSSLPSHVQLLTQFPDTPVMCEIDPTDVLQVMINLVINARDAIADQPGIIRVGLSDLDGADIAQRGILGAINPQKRYATVYVEDDGTGISDDDLSALFEAYFTTKSQSGGTGLGLSVVRSLVQASGGVIDVTTQLGAGTRFTIFWPLDAASVDVENEQDADPEVVDLSGVKVIVVDDDLPVADTIATLLEKAGCETIVCDAPEDALTVIADDPAYWDVVVTDYDMPDMNGADLAQRIRKIADNLPIILCTALPVYMGRARDGANLFDARLSKPVNGKQLVFEIGRTIGK
ncbi:PAS domain S-box protein [Algirhabdus cladophorae]|uniref:hybrid sensor histidine kinase/response regulator n=1 Tax=Algirhabdus cladophorae TaxID=3377108 RepID=UPI003B84790F